MARPLPRRRAWRRTFGSDWSSALTGMFLGLLGSGIAYGLTFLIEAMHWSATIPSQRPGIGDMAMSLFIIPAVIACYGTAIAILPMTTVVLLERLTRIDLGAICWMLFGLIPSTLLGAILSGSVSGGVAMGAGGVGGLVSWTRRHSAQNDGPASWGTTLIACVAVTVLTIALCVHLPRPKSD